MSDYSVLIARLVSVEKLDHEECDAFTREAMLDAADAIRELVAFRTKVVESGVYFPVMD